MRFHHLLASISPELADAVDLQSLLDKLADFLLQSGFAGGDNQSYYGWDDGRRGRALARRAQAGDPPRAHGERAVHARDARGARAAATTRKARRSSRKLLDQLVQRLIDEGYLNVDARAADARRAPVQSPAPAAWPRPPRSDVQFNLTEKGIDFLGYKTLTKPARLARQVELRQPRHALSRHRHRGRRVEQAVRVRRRAQPRRQRDAQERARPHREASASRWTSSTAT